MPLPLMSKPLVKRMVGISGQVEKRQDFNWKELQRSLVKPLAKSFILPTTSLKRG